jgi:hypothetical protein
MLCVRVLFFLPLMNGRLLRVAQKTNYIAPIDNEYERQMDVRLPWLHVRFASIYSFPLLPTLFASIFFIYRVRLCYHAYKTELAPPL